MIYTYTVYIHEMETIKSSGTNVDLIADGTSLIYNLEITYISTLV